MATAQDIETAAELLIATEAASVAAKSALDTVKALVDSDVSTEYNAMESAAQAYQTAFDAAKGARNYDSIANAYAAALTAQDEADLALRALAQEFLTPT